MNPFFPPTSINLTLINPQRKKNLEKGITLLDESYYLYHHTIRAKRQKTKTKSKDIGKKKCIDEIQELVNLISFAEEEEEEE